MDGNKSIDVSLKLDTVQFNINTNVSATITINGDSSTGVTTKTVAVIRGSSVSWSVEASGYVTQSGSQTVSEDTTKGISLELKTYTFTVTSNVSSTITINGSSTSNVTSKSVTVNHGSNVTWSVKASRYASQSGTESNVASEVTKSITLTYTGITSTCTARFIWCTDGSFVDPAKFSSSGKTAYGYALSSSTVARLTRSGGRGRVWASKNSSWSNTKFTGAQSLTDGVANSNYLKAQSGYSSTNCPAVYDACTQTNAGKTSYMPARDELSTLYNSIMTGNMKTDLTTAGLYESCNYSKRSEDSSTGWCHIWSSSQHSKYSDEVWRVTNDGNQDRMSKYTSLHTDQHVIPFFNF